MPFRSKSQLRTCYSLHDPRWDCDSWLRKTKGVCDLPEKVGMPRRSRTHRTGEAIKGQIQTGPRGGKYFTITEKDKDGVICEFKVYLSRKNK